MHFIEITSQLFRLFVLQSPKPVPMKILSVEDLERNIHNQQQQQKSSVVTSRSQTPLNMGLPSPNGSVKRPIDANNTNGVVLQPNGNGALPNKLPPRMPPGFPAIPPMLGRPGHPPMGSPLPMHPGNMPMPGGMHRPPPPPSMQSSPHFPVSKSTRTNSAFIISLI